MCWCQLQKLEKAAVNSMALLRRADLRLLCCSSSCLGFGNITHEIGIAAVNVQCLHDLSHSTTPVFFWRAVVNRIRLSSCRHQSRIMEKEIQVKFIAACCTFGTAANASMTHFNIDIQLFLTATNRAVKIPTGGFNPSRVKAYKAHHIKNGKIIKHLGFSPHFRYLSYFLCFRINSNAARSS